MKKLFSILKGIFTWIFAVAGIFLGVFTFIAVDKISYYIFGGGIIIFSLLIIPYINRKIKIRSRYLIIGYAICILGFISLDFFNSQASKNKNLFYVSANTLNVREGKDIKFEILYKLKKGSAVKVIKEHNDWVEINTSKGKGFVSKKYLSKKKPKSNKLLTYIIIGGFILYSLSSNKSRSNNTSKQKKKKSSEKKERKSSYHVEDVSKKLPSKPIKQKTEDPRHICKHCGWSSTNLAQLTVTGCAKSPSKKHEPFEGGIQETYICKHCGWSSSNLAQLTVTGCAKSPTSKHQPFEGGIKSKYLCKHCGWGSSNLAQLTVTGCAKSPTGKHQPLI